MNKSKVKIMVEKFLSKVFRVFGMCWAILGVIGMISDWDNWIYSFIFLVVVGLAIYYVGRKKKIRIQTFQNYVKVLAGNPTGSIEQMAASLGTSQEEVKNNLAELIKRNYFAHAYINYDTNCIVIRSNQNTEEALNGVGDNSAEHKEYVAITCKNCGGSNKCIKDTVSECEYCGSPL